MEPASPRESARPPPGAPAPAAQNPHPAPGPAHQGKPKTQGALRALTDLNQEQLAVRMHVNKSLVAQVERGHKPATQSFITAAADALNVDITEMTGQPYRGRTAASDRIHAAIPEIRQAVAYWDIAPGLDTPPWPLAKATMRR